MLPGFFFLHSIGRNQFWFFIPEGYDDDAESGKKNRILEYRISNVDLIL